MRTNLLTPFKQGYLAFEQGIPISNNPYDFPREQYDWLRGWCEAQEYRAWSERQSDAAA